MKTTVSRFLTAALGLLFVFDAAQLLADQPYLGLARQITGSFEGIAGPGNNLRIVVQPARPVPDERRFSVTVQGKYNGDNVRFDGFLSLQPQGDGVRLLWFTRRSVDCQVDIHPAGDGFEGVTAAGACQTAFQSPTPGKWEFQTEPGSFRLRNVESGETLRFRKTKSPGK